MEPICFEVGLQAAFLNAPIHVVLDHNISFQLFKLNSRKNSCLFFPHSPYGFISNASGSLTVPFLVEGRQGAKGKRERWLIIFCVLKFQALYFPPFQTLPFCFQLHWASFIPCSGSPLRTNVGYSGSISFNEKDGGRTDGDTASLWRRAACSALRLQGAEMGHQMCNFPWGTKVSLWKSLDPSHNFTLFSFCFISLESWLDF